MVDPSKFELYHFPLIDRTLFGLTVLVFEDGHFACEAIRLQSARRHLQVYRPSVVIVDIGFPDGNGTELIEKVHAASPRMPVVLATSGDSFGKAVALAADADGFFAKPLKSLAVFQETILSLMQTD